MSGAHVMLAAQRLEEAILRITEMTGGGASFAALHLGHVLIAQADAPGPIDARRAVRDTVAAINERKPPREAGHAVG